MPDALLVELTQALHVTPLVSKKALKQEAQKKEGALQKHALQKKRLSLQAATMKLHQLAWHGQARAKPSVSKSCAHLFTVHRLLH